MRLYLWGWSIKINRFQKSAALFQLAEARKLIRRHRWDFTILRSNCCVVLVTGYKQKRRLKGLKNRINEFPCKSLCAIVWNNDIRAALKVEVLQQQFFIKKRSGKIAMHVFRRNLSWKMTQYTPLRKTTQYDRKIVMMKYEKPPKIKTSLG